MGVESSGGDGPKYCCLWVGCKVYGKKSSSLKWLESHVPRHGGKFAYPCIVEGCRMRFSSQVGISLKYFCRGETLNIFTISCVLNNAAY